jgi:uncharacterized protein (TIGR03435 family)
MKCSIRAAAATAAVLLVSLASMTTAQNQSLAFEVASIKRSPANRFVPPVLDPLRFRVVESLEIAIEWAYQIHGYQLSGGLPWVHRDYYQIEGRAQGPSTPQEMRLMLQGLLAERFKLKLHRESKEMSIYALVVGNSGPRLQSSAGACSMDGCIDVGPGAFNARWATMDAVAVTLSNLVDRPVLDKTGLTGRYDFRMKFDPTLIKPYDGQPASTPSTDSPTIFSALQELGLKLEPRRSAVEILVIDSAAEPSEN